MGEEPGQTAICGKDGCTFRDLTPEEMQRTKADWAMEKAIQSIVKDKEVIPGHEP